jgi:hypothetical protein
MARLSACCGRLDSGVEGRLSFGIRHKSWVGLFVSVFGLRFGLCASGHSTGCNFRIARSETWGGLQSEPFNYALHVSVPIPPPKRRMTSGLPKSLRWAGEGACERFRPHPGRLFPVTTEA